MSSPLLTLPLEIRQQIFHSLVLIPHTITVSLSTIPDCYSPIECLSRTCKQLHHEIVTWSSLKISSSYLLAQPLGLITPRTKIQFHLLPNRRVLPSLIKVSKTPQNIEEVAVFQLWRDIMVKLNTCEMERIDREIRDRFDKGDERVMSVLEGVYDEFMKGKGRGTTEDVMIYGGNRHWVISTNLWGLNICDREGLVTDGD